MRKVGLNFLSLSTIVKKFQERKRERMKDREKERMKERERKVSPI